MSEYIVRNQKILTPKGNTIVHLSYPQLSIMRTDSFSVSFDQIIQGKSDGLSLFEREDKIYNKKLDIL
jgi:hypothetical protein